jgi:hypothetical protein
MLKTIIEIKKNAVFNNITDTLVQFKVLDHVLSAFKNLYDIQKKEVECIKLQKNGVQKDALSLQLPYVMNFLQTKGIDCNNLLAGIQQLRNMCNSEMSNKKRSRNNDTTSNSSILPTMPINKVSKVSDSNHLIEVPVAIIESPLKSISYSSGLTFSTPQSSAFNNTKCVHVDNINPNLLSKYYKDDLNNTPLKLETTMKLLDHPKAVQFFIEERKFSREFLTSHGDDMYISMLLCLKFNVMLFPDPGHVQRTFLHCLALKLNLSIEAVKSIIIGYIDKNRNDIILSVFVRNIYPSNFDLTDINNDNNNDDEFNNSLRNIFLNKYKEEIEKNNISDVTFNFLYNHLHKIFTIKIVLFTFRNFRVELKYCPKEINLQKHEFNEKDTFAIVEDSGLYKALWRMEPCYQISASAESISTHAD